MRNYLKKSIAAFIAVFFLICINWDILKVLQYYIKIDKIYFALSSWSNAIIFYAVFLVITVVFYFLADFGFEARTNQENPVDTQ